MKVSYSCILLLLMGMTLTTYVVAQTETDSKSSQTEEAQLNPEEMPSYMGGTERLMMYLRQNIQYPEEARTNKIEGMVYVQFQVTEKGKIDKIKVLKGIGYGCDEEAIRVVKGMGKWKPGNQGGKPVSAHMTLPVNFTLIKNKPLENDETKMEIEKIKVKRKSKLKDQP